MFIETALEYTTAPNAVAAFTLYSIVPAVPPDTPELIAVSFSSPSVSDLVYMFTPAAISLGVAKFLPAESYCTV